jgi:hypothetical protein
VQVQPAFIFLPLFILSIGCAVLFNDLSSPFGLHINLKSKYILMQIFQHGPDFLLYIHTDANELPLNLSAPLIYLGLV